MKQPSVRRKWLSAAVVGGLLVTVGSAPAWAQDSPEDINDEIDAVDEDLAAAVEEYNQLASEVDENRELIEETEANLQTAEAELDVLREQLADFIGETYVDQGIGDAALLLESGTPDAFVERMDRLNSANLYNFDLMGDLRAASEEYAAQSELLTDLQADLEAEQAELQKAADELTDRMTDLEEEWKTAAGEEVLEYDLPHMSNEQWTIVDFALDQIGEPYVWGSDGPDSWDCSGLMLGAYAQAGISLPHNAAAQWDMVAHISEDELQPGDFVFYNGLAHVGMYIGNGLIVHAPNSTTVVKVVEVHHGNSYYGAGTLLH
ncbi:NlpC/P60 family protein [Glycomyces luteolus]|uniref:NlpC/P60 family protein n=1 Tax=Glycomyces luteolus TaxID=2670330 RepID=A0A9X3PDX4_9ACTN|nr:C40 family peptidase [Glycomyces luteolus]MDA1362236.1 NlpC/P60 family protein [Glycomyces luteolus]